MHQLRNIIALAAALAVAAGGCSKERRSSTVEPEAPGAITGRYATPSPIVHAAKRAVDVSLFPKDTDVLFSVRVSAFAKGPLFEVLRKKLRDQEDVELAEFKKLCQLDPFRDVHAVTIGGSFSGDKRFAVLVQGSFTQAKIKNCVKKIAKKNKTKVSISQQGAITVYKTDDKPVYAAWLGSGTVVMGESREFLTDLIARSSSAHNNIKLGEVLRETDRSASVWAAGVVPSSFSNMGLVGKDVRTQAGYLNLFYTGRGLKVTVGLLTGSREQAQRASKKLREMLTTMGPASENNKLLSHSVRFSSRGSLVVATLKLSKADLAKVIAELSPKNNQQAPDASPPK